MQEIIKTTYSLSKLPDYPCSEDVSCNSLGKQQKRIYSTIHRSSDPNEQDADDGRNIDMTIESALHGSQIVVEIVDVPPSPIPADDTLEVISVLKDLIKDVVKSTN